MCPATNSDVPLSDFNRSISMFGEHVNSGDFERLALFNRLELFMHSSGIARAV